MCHLVAREFKVAAPYFNLDSLYTLLSCIKEIYNVMNFLGCQTLLYKVELSSTNTAQIIREFHGFRSYHCCCVL